MWTMGGKEQVIESAGIMIISRPAIDEKVWTLHEEKEGAEDCCTCV